MVEVRLDQLGEVRAVPFGARVRVQLGDERWPDLRDLELLVSRVYGASNVEVAGASGTAVADAERFLRDRLCALHVQLGGEHW